MRILILSVLFSWLAGCAVKVAAPAPTFTAQPTPSPAGCPLTQPEWLTPPDDPAVRNRPEPGYYYVNEQRTIWATAWWKQPNGEDQPWQAGRQGVKVGWFRPAGEALQVSGQRLDGDPGAAHLEARLPCCYPTRFQSSGLFFPTPGCWRVTAEAAGERLEFVVEIEEQDREETGVEAVQRVFFLVRP